MKVQKLFVITLVICLALNISIIGFAMDQKNEVLLKFAHVAAPTRSYAQACDKVAEWAEERSGGRLKIEVFPGGQLGNERDSAESVKMGTIDMCLVCSSTLGIWEDDFSILGVAFIWKDFDHMLKVVRGTIGQEMMDKLVKSTGVKVLDMGWIDGQRQFNTNKPIRTPDDIVGLKIRVPETPIYFSNMKAMGASVVAMPFSEVFTSVQTGVIDGQENPLNSIYVNKFYEITKYVSLSAHVTLNLAIIINNDRFNKMPKDLQDILVKATIDAGDWLTQQTIETFDRDLHLLIDEGMTIIDDVDRDAFREKCKGPILEEWGEKWTEGLYEKIVEMGN
ncbi:MAG: TRAP transporter substrate-binding protein [Candidatus Atribacteria bacterium]|nr:TRAP transporter substrate-binding protein [Candidatus Atribacteria bacterium]